MIMNALWHLVRYLHPADHHPAIIRKVDISFRDELDFADIKFPVKKNKLRVFTKLKKIILLALVFLVMKTK